MKKIKMLLYGEPGTGKSVFASKFPKPFFVTTDGNYEWLIDFGAKEEAHQRVQSWSEAKKLFKNNNFDNYETVVLDLTEDLFKWCEAEWCKRNEIEHPSDMGWGKGYEGPRNEFFIEISKLLNLDKNIVLICHGETISKKNKKGVEFNEYRPTSRIPDKLLDMIEGRVRYCLRCYTGTEEKDGKIYKRRYLSLVPKEDEYGIIRGVNENDIPHTIELEYNIFADIVLGAPVEEPKARAKRAKEKVDAKVEEVKETGEDISTKKDQTNIPIDTSDNTIEVEEVEVVKTPSKEDKLAALKAKMKEKESTSVEDTPVETTPVVEVVNEPQKPMSKEDKLAALKAKMRAMNKGE